MADFSPVAGANSPCDGRCGKDDASWSTCRDATDGDLASNGSGGLLMDSTSNHNGSIYSITRVFINFDTSSIADGDNVTAATLTMIPAILNDGDNDGDDFIVVVGLTPSTTADVANADYDQTGTTELSDRVDLGSMTADVSVVFTLNASGRAAINKTGITSLALREGHDLLNNTIASSASNSVDWYSTDYSSGVNKPVLSVTAVTPSGVVYTRMLTGFGY